jgi:DNA-binding NarL/FixJ family response regulator
MHPAQRAYGSARDNPNSYGTQWSAMPAPYPIGARAGKVNVNDSLRNSSLHATPGSDPAYVPWPITGIAHAGSPDARLFRLTPRQAEILALMSEGLPTKTIARRLTIANGTVKAHIGAILRALGVVSRLQAVLAAQRRGLLSQVDLQQLG